MDQEEKTERNDANSFPNKVLKSFGRGAREQLECRRPGRIPADLLAKIIVVAITVLLFIGLLVSFFVPSSRKPPPKASESYKEKLDYARKKRQEGKDLIMESYNCDLARTRNKLLKQAEDTLRKSQETYSELIGAHDEGGYGYLQTEAAEVQSYIYHCLKTRTIDLD